jgi:hypothetical protein
MFRLAEVAIFRLNMQYIIKMNTCDYNLCFNIRNLQRQYIVCVNM